MSTPASPSKQQYSEEHEEIDTSVGKFHCYVHGDKNAPHVIITLHDIGQNHTHFQQFLTHPDMQSILHRLCIAHITLPGQENNAENLEVSKYPTMQRLADALPELLEKLGVNGDVIGFGLGAGANILLRYALQAGSKVMGLILMECTAQSAGFLEWGKDVAAAWNLSHKGMNPDTENYLLWHKFGRTKDKCSCPELQETIKSYRDFLYNHMNPKNLAAYIESYRKRSDVLHNLMKQPLNCSVLLISGDHSPHLQETLKIVKEMNATNMKHTTFLKAEDVGGDIMDENPEKLAESCLYFLQGLGLVASVRRNSLLKVRTGSFDQTN